MPNRDQQKSGSTSNRGFASMDAKKQREIASKGGKAAHALGVAHEFSPEEARIAGRKGGEAVSRNRSHMAEIGRRGGEARGESSASRAAMKRARQMENRSSASGGNEGGQEGAP